MNVESYSVLKDGPSPGPSPFVSSQPDIVGPVSILNEANTRPTKGAVNELNVSGRSSSSAGAQCRKNVTTIEVDVVQQTVPASSQYSQLQWWMI